MADGLPGYWYSRFVFERGLALIYLVAFVCAVNQFVPLLGERGLLPVSRFVRVVPFRASPSLFFFFPTDAAFRAAAWLGVGLSSVAFSGLLQQHGIVSGAVWTMLWILYLSFVNVGQTFYGFGWESLLLETGFFAIFLGSSQTEPSAWLLWIWRWVLFRVMNFSFNTVHLVNTYGAFGSITRTRREIVIEGTDEATITAGTTWRAYEFKGKPGDPSRTPLQIAPYHLRLDWLMWFAAMSSPSDHPWFTALLVKLLEGDRATLDLLRTNPFPDRPPRYVRALYYEYRFTSREERRRTRTWWHRELLGEYYSPAMLRAPEQRREPVLR